MRGRPVAGPSTLAACTSLLALSLLLAGAAASVLPGVANRTTALEQLRSVVPCSRVQDFITADHAVWTPYLEQQLGFVEKQTLISTAPAPAPDANCSVWSRIRWQSHAMWDSIPGSELGVVQAQFEAAYGGNPPLQAVPTPHGLDFLLDLFSAAPSTPSTPSNSSILVTDIYSLPCASVASFVGAFNASFGSVFRASPGFVHGLLLADGRTLSPAGPSAANCSVWAQVHWDTASAWDPTGPQWGKAAALLATALGFLPAVAPFPGGHSLSVALDVMPQAGARLPAIDGFDVVAYHKLPAGHPDVRGSPDFSVALNASLLLPPELLHLHPRDYVFWFSSKANQAAFQASPKDYLPFAGGFSVSTLPSMRWNASDAVLGHGAPACVNTTRWTVANNTLYLNACEDFSAFAANPTHFIASTEALWRSWFGDFPGPVNDACLEDGGVSAWSGGRLVPSFCSNRRAL